MSSVPYIFANQTGNIALSQLDANFSNVKANVDYATASGTATQATTVTASAQPNITSVGPSLTVSGNITAGNVLSSGSTSITGNITGGNIITSGKLQYTGLQIVSPNYISVTGNAQTANLSATNTTNILIANNTGYTLTVNMPTGPVDGQITKFAISGNTVTLVLGTGTATPTFAGSTTAGTAYTYVYRNSNTTWYRTN